MTTTLHPGACTGAEGSPPSAAFIDSALEVRPRPGLAPDDLPPALRNGAVLPGDLERSAGPSAEAVHAQLEALADAKMVTFSAGSGPDCLAELRPMAPGFRLTAVPRGNIVMSRFAHMRAENGTLVLETPLGVGAVRVLDASAVSALGSACFGSRCGEPDRARRAPGRNVCLPAAVGVRRDREPVG